MSITHLLGYLSLCVFFIACQKAPEPFVATPPPTADSTVIITPPIDSITPPVDSTVIITPPADSAVCTCGNTYTPGTLYVIGSNSSIAVGGTATFRWELVFKQDVLASGSGASLDYCEYDPSIITINSNGVLTGLAPGTTTIRICMGNQSNYRIVSVY